MVFGFKRNHREVLPLADFINFVNFPAGRKPQLADMRQAMDIFIQLHEQAERINFKNRAANFLPDLVFLVHLLPGVG